MIAAFRLLARYGVSVAFADLGTWGSAELRSEYDPCGPAIRLNARVAARLGPDEFTRFVATAIGHELYHHRECIGEIGVIANRTERERAAERFALDLADPHR
ncbi:MAG: hypothetical protein JOY69_08830 [Candidatus Eremiobacteraeota bacterium]|nr:hypothetical protein [Candidatus Eremiobacteraeota bacterium]